MFSYYYLFADMLSSESSEFNIEPNSTFLQNVSSENLTKRQMESCGSSTLDEPSTRAIFIFAYLVVFISCFGGNFLLLTVVGLHPAMRTVTNFFLANLATADLLIALFCVAQNMMHLFILQAVWPLGMFMCKMYVFVMHLIPCTSAGLLLVLSCERYIAIMHPILARTLLTKGRLALTTAIIWAISVATNLPYFMHAKLGELSEKINTSVNVNGSQIYQLIQKPGSRIVAWCTRSDESIDQRIMFTFSFIFWYILPFTAMLVIYSIIGVALWRSTSVDAVASTSSATNPSGNRSKRRSYGDTSTVVSRQISSGGISMATSRMDSPKCEQEGLEMISLNSPNDETIDSHRSKIDSNANRKHISAVKISVNGRPIQNTGSNDAREAVEGRKRVIRLLISIICSFAILTLPNHVRLLMNAWSPITPSCLNGFKMVFQPLSYLLLFVNSGINPILYAFMSKKFRRAVREIFSRKALREQRRERFLTSIRSTTATTNEY